MGTMRWQDWVELALGIWLAISPWVLGFQDMAFATWNAVLLGLAIIVFAAIELRLPKAWEEWVSLVMGLWLVVSPFVPGFHSALAASWNTFAVGILTALFAAWAMSLDKQIGKWWDQHVTGH